MKPLVYLAGPYSSDPVQNTRRAILHGIDVRERYDCAVIIPHLTLVADIVCPQPVDYWYQFDLEQIPHCDAMIRIPGESTGADAETAEARKLNIPVFQLEDVGTIRLWRQGWDEEWGPDA